MKKFLMMIVAIFMMIGTAFAYSPDSNAWEQVATDKNGNVLYVHKKAISSHFMPFHAEGDYALMVSTLALTPSGNGTYYIDIVRHHPTYGGVVKHSSMQNFIGSMDNVTTPDMIDIDPNKVPWYSVSDPWFAAEYNYAFKRADELGIDYK